jgi:hypothetical protein|tara:strand:- start:244 stop:414 length:171 start_codon:yes stop_codon:yes gene_type:complete
MYGSNLERRLNELKDTCHDMTNLDGMNKELWSKHMETINATLHVLDLLTMRIEVIE